jgi:hypothetical protein
MTNPRVTRGRQTEELVAKFLRENGFPHAERRPASLPGADIMGIPDVAIEVKSRRKLDLPGWLKQASTRDGLPVVVSRPDGFGPEKIGLWPVTLRLQEFAPVLYHWYYCESFSCVEHGGVVVAPDDGHEVTSGS